MLYLTPSGRAASSGDRSTAGSEPGLRSDTSRYRTADAPTISSATPRQTVQFFGALTFTLAPVNSSIIAMFSGA